MDNLKTDFDQVLVLTVETSSKPHDDVVTMLKQRRRGTV